MTQERAPRPHDPLLGIRHQVADAVGGLMELWGFKRIMGRTWALLYLADAPLAAAELGDALQVSPGSVSMTVSELLKWGVVKKTWIPGDRRDFYVPETSVWKMVSRVIRERELLHVRETNDRLTAAQNSLTELQQVGGPGDPRPASSDGSADAATRAAMHVLHSRIAALQQLSQVGQLLIEQVLGGRTIDVVRLQQALNLVVSALPAAAGPEPAESADEELPDPA
jgi:DNA-binding transcriptional regulator GbsR (MarR family)